ncbi:MAG: hypothetical protein APR62_02770 [Smithella sp. SDB]|nr:MAG: hypothetical protein APR62_02770 [Smithella sp. SDB]
MHRHKFYFVVTVFTLIVAGIFAWTLLAAAESQSSIEQTFQKAKQKYLDKNMNSAAQQIQKGASFVKTQAEKASDKGKEKLDASAKELEKLADDVKKGTVTSVRKIEDAFARAYAALAFDSHIKSTQSWAKNQKEKAGDALDSANKYLEHGFTWAGQKIEKGTKEVIRKSDELSQTLKKKGSLLAEEVGKGLKNAGDEIEKFGKNISPN